VSNESDITALQGSHKFDRGTVEVIVKTPREAAESMAQAL
jgi:hypothetical protein